MNRLTKKWLPCLSVLAALLFVFQATASYADHAGLIPCADETAQHSNATENGGDAHCCCVHLPTALTSATSFGFFALSLKTSLPTDDSCPESLAREIDHPPQLS